jgi:hypothetical protein
MSNDLGGKYPRSTTGNSLCIITASNEQWILFVDIRSKDHGMIDHEILAKFWEIISIDEAAKLLMLDPNGPQYA